jgi:dihydroflavonol-4-reductase
MIEIAQVLRQHLGEAARRVPRREMPDWLARALALVVPQMRGALPMLGRRRRASGDKARRLLGWHARPNEEIILATAESLLMLGLVKRRGS